MKIGILTFTNTLNYGALLQAYALQAMVKKLGYDAEMIDYNCEAVIKREKPISLDNISSIRDVARFLLLRKAENSKHRKFLDFEKRYISKSEKTYNKGNISLINSLYDKFIVGSDQVWNLSLTDADYTFYLDFVVDREKKNSYAASFGYEDIPAQFKLETVRLLQQFKNIAVRENSGKVIINKYLDRDTKVVLDPTLLIEAEEWAGLCNCKFNYGDYVLVYFTSNRKETYKQIRKFAKERKCKIIYINIDPWKHLGAKDVWDYSPEEFVYLIKNAKYVFTGSFHGTAFSINFNKQFFVEKKGGKTNTRIDNLLNLFDLQDRYLIDDLDSIEEVDYENINNLLKMYRENSIRELTGILNSSE